ncbi:Type-1 restriction enzyme EcoKI specificity protein [Flavobacterium anhuiense]|uniref:Type-1 restriction enzyme EcoKI specificity protein n=1 Tax=Flavobacterium anhuiense TaxID=459526 RepID=A0AAC9GHR2_9FLAO|nr:restriction endonuclease subunit S [Flavobacterium anhuiense]AOC94578.1 Type-1 restriction enzyme EcoKI specificity protein [Flavobacterium anhuiense]
MITKKFISLFDFLPNSKIKAGDGLDEGNFSFFTSSSILKKKINKAQYFDEALIFGTGGSASVHYSKEPFSTSTDCIVAKSTYGEHEINIKYVYYYLTGNIHLIERGFKGAGLKHISKKYIENIEIPIVSIESQNKIVAVLDKANSIIKKREDSIKVLDELTRAKFLEMFQNELVNFKKSKTNLNDIVSINSGLTKGRKTKEKETIDVPYLRVANAQDGYFDLKEIKYISATEREISNYNILKGDLLITEGGDPDKLGRGSVWELEENKYIYQNHLYRLRIKDLTKYSSYWLMYLISSEFGKYYFLRQAKQTTGIATVNKKQVSQFPIPKSSFSRQKEFEKYFLNIKKINRYM